MSKAVPLRTDINAAELAKLARNSDDADQSRRLIALSHVASGGSRSEAAQLGGVTLQIIRDWVLRFNAEGAEGLKDRKAPGGKPKLDEAQQEALAKRVESGPDPEKDGVVRWRCSDLVAWVEEEFGVSMKAHSMSRWLKRLGFSRVSGRPQSAQQDPQALKTFKKTSPKSWRKSKPGSKREPL